MPQEVLTEGLIELPGDAGTLWLRDYSNGDPREPNLCLMDSSGRKVWDAAEVQSLDKWVAVRLEDSRILANSGGGFLCELDPVDGSIISSEFVK